MRIRSKTNAFANAAYAFGSGFPDASDTLFDKCVTKDCRLPAHSTLSVAFGNVFANHLETKLEIENVMGRSYPINLGSEFNGSHFSPPRLVTIRAGYRF